MDSLDESCCNDHPGSEVSSKEVDVKRDAKRLDSHREDWKEGDGCGDDQNDEDRRDARTKVAIVLIPAVKRDAKDLVQLVSREVVEIEDGKSRWGVQRHGCIDVASPGVCQMLVADGQSQQAF